MSSIVLGLFSDRDSAERTIRDLKSAGFDERHIGLLMKANDRIQFPAPEKPVNAAKGAAAGAVTGGIGGTILGTLAPLVIPGIGPFIAGGVLVAALSGAAGGALYGALVGQNVPDFAAQRYQRRVAEGDVLVLVDAGEREDEARQIIQRNGAVDVRDERDLENELRKVSPQSVTTVRPEETPESPSAGLADAKTFYAAKKREAREEREDAGLAPPPPQTPDTEPRAPSST